MKKIVIVGANSYIARNLLWVLKEKKEEYQVKLYDCAEQHIDGDDRYTAIDILDEQLVARIDMDCDLLYMFVGKTGSMNGFDEYNTFIDINERAILNVLNEYRNQKSEAKIVFPSTRLVYKGRSGAQKEDAPKEFKTIYAMNKYACEMYLEQYQRVFGVKYCILRICVPYGTLVPNATSYGTAEFMLGKAMNGENITLFGDGSVRRTLVHMRDLCDTMIIAGLHEGCINDVYNIGGEDYSLREMGELIANKHGVNIDYVEWPEMALKIESGDTVFDDSKLKGIIGETIKSRFTEWIM